MMSVNTESKKQSMSSNKVPVLDTFPLRFPPFPVVLHSATIIPFQDFVPYGYKRVKLETGEEIEVDALAGLPTVKVLSEEEVARIIKDRKKRRNAGQSTDSTGRIVPWWEEWEEGENLRKTREPIDLYLYHSPCSHMGYSLSFIQAEKPH